MFDNSSYTEVLVQYVSVSHDSKSRHSYSSCTTADSMLKVVDHYTAGYI